ncbi:hypothetical protein PT974_07210 [Cladobotryum mycophilum]|uniref:Uncharacterized protein n=1 Tax=Cladobotryum mycophilum TaxID=491253 RepID=A0ABR0SNV2_9HYPO
MPFINGNTKLMATPRINDHAVGGLYRITGELDEVIEGESSSPGEYCSLSERIVTPDSARWLLKSSVDIDMMTVGTQYRDFVTGCRCDSFNLDAGRGAAWRRRQPSTQRASFQAADARSA